MVTSKDLIFGIFCLLTPLCGLRDWILDATVLCTNCNIFQFLVIRY